MSAEYIARALALGSVVRLADGRVASVAPQTPRDRKAGHVRIYLHGQEDPEHVEYHTVVTLLYGPTDLARRALASLAGAGVESENARLAARLADAEEQARTLTHVLAACREERQAAAALAEHLGFLLRHAQERLDAQTAREEQARLEREHDARTEAREEQVAALSASAGAEARLRHALRRREVALEYLLASHTGWDDMGTPMLCDCALCLRALDALERADTPPTGDRGERAPCATPATADHTQVMATAATRASQWGAA